MWRADSLEKTLWCWERLKAGEGNDRGWDGWMASPTQWTWVWVNSRGWWWTERPGMLQFMAWQRVGHDWATELNCILLSTGHTGDLGHAQLQSRGPIRSTCLNLPRDLVLERLSCLNLLVDTPIQGYPEVIMPRPAQRPNSQEAILPRPSWGFSLQEAVTAQLAWGSSPWPRDA